MRRVGVISLLAFATWAYASDLAMNQTADLQDSTGNLADRLVGKLVDGMLDRALDAPSLQRADLDDTALGKAGHVATPTNLLSVGSGRLHSQPFMSARPSLPSLSRGQFQRLPSKSLVAYARSQSERADAAKVLKPEVVAPESQSLTEAPGAPAAKEPYERETWELMAVAEDALKREHFTAALAFSMAAATLLFSDEASAAVAAAAGSAAGVDWSAIVSKAAGKALGGGKAGATAAVVQVFSLMWLRTAMNYQYRYGGNLQSALKTLTEEGGIGRLYQGLPFALVQGPLSRFGDTATNVGVLALFDAIPAAAGVPGPLRTAAASASAGLFRIFCTPIDTAKTAMQVEGSEGLGKLGKRVAAQGPAPLYQGSIASAVATFAGNYPWFLTYNSLDGYLPTFSKEEVLQTLIRSALLGLSASCVSDTVSNSLRVIKTTQQTAALNDDPSVGDKSKSGISIADALKIVLETDGIKGLFGRGLQTRLLTNAIQGSLFSVLWRYFQASGTR